MAKSIKKKGKPPRRDAEAMKIMAERSVIRSTKEDLNKTEIVELLKATSRDWAMLWQAISPKVEVAIKKPKLNTEISYLQTFKHLDLEELS